MRYSKLLYGKANMLALTVIAFDINVLSGRSPYSIVIALQR